MDEVSVSGVVKEYGGIYGLVATKVLKTMKEILCIALLEPKI